MTDAVDIDETTLTHRVVLVGLASLSSREETPVHAGEVRRVCTGRLDAVEADVVGTLTAAAVTRTLNELEADRLVEASRDETSPTGKGRPRYALAVDREGLLEALGEDERLSALVEQVAS